jgi:hypothetical protein
MEFLSDKITIVELPDAEGAFATANEAFAGQFGSMPLVSGFQSEVGAE